MPVPVVRTTRQPSEPLLLGAALAFLVSMTVASGFRCDEPRRDEHEELGIGAFR